VIETSGLADPSPILQTFATDRALGEEFAVEVLMAAVDAVTGEATLASAPEARKQMILADRLIVTKTDLADTAMAEQMIQELRKINTRAAIDVAVGGVLDPDRFVTPTAIESAGERSGFVAEATHSDDITSFVLTAHEPIDWPPFARTMETLIALRGADLLRVKGLLNVAGCRGPVVVQFVQHLAHPPVELQSWPDEDHTCRLVFITRNIPERLVRDLWTATRALVSPKTRSNRENFNL